MPPASMAPRSRTARAPPAVALGGFELPKFELPSFGGEPLTPKPGDVQFKDVDGDMVTLRNNFGKVDFYVGSTCCAPASPVNTT